MKATNDYIQVEETSGHGVQTADNNLKLGKVVSLGERCKSSQEFMVDETKVSFKKGDKVLFDTNKALKHDGLWYLKGNSVFAYDDN
jgi:co-chaperonin GroES (HSP10)